MKLHFIAFQSIFIAFFTTAAFAHHQPLFFPPPNTLAGGIPYHFLPERAVLILQSVDVLLNHPDCHIPLALLLYCTMNLLCRIIAAGVGKHPVYDAIPGHCIFVYGHIYFDFYASLAIFSETYVRILENFFAFGQIGTQEREAFEMECDAFIIGDQMKGGADPRGTCRQDRHKEKLHLAR